MQISLHFCLWALDRTCGLGTDKIKTFLQWYLKRAGYRRTKTAAGMKEAESSFSLEKFYHEKMKNRIPEIVWMCFSDYGSMWWKILFAGSLLYRDSVGRGRTEKERVRCKLWLIETWWLWNLNFLVGTSKFLNDFETWWLWNLMTLKLEIFGNRNFRNLGIGTLK